MFVLCYLFKQNVKSTSVSSIHIRFPTEFCFSQVYTTQLDILIEWINTCVDIGVRIDIFQVVHLLIKTEAFDDWISFDFPIPSICRSYNLSLLVFIDSCRVYVYINLHLHVGFANPVHQLPHCDLGMSNLSTKLIPPSWPVGVVKLWHQQSH